MNKNLQELRKINLLLKKKLCQINNQLKNYINQLLKILKNKKYTFKDNVCGADLVDMQLISEYNKSICFLLCIIDIYSKYEWVLPLKDKKVLQLLMLFKKF